MPLVLEPSLLDLNLLGIDHGDLVRDLTRNCAIGTSFVAVTTALVCLVGGLSLVPCVAVVVTVVPAVMWTLFVSRIKRNASRQRADMNVAVAVFLDLVNVLIAGGAGIETAMLAAANAGDGKSFQRIRLALATAQGTRTSYWESLRSLGSGAGLACLEDLANSVQMAGEQGSRIRLTLTAKARTLRVSNLARIEHDAEERTELMGLPVVLMFLGFVLLIGYPAFVSTIGAL